MKRDDLVHGAVPVIAAAFLILAYFTIKHALHVATLGGLAAALFLFCLPAAARRDMAGRCLFIVVGMPIIGWSFTNPWLLYLVMCLWVPMVALRIDKIVPVYLFSLLMLPGLDSTAAIGALKLFDFGVHDALAIGAAIALFLNPAKARSNWLIDLPACALLLLLAAALARDTSFSNFLRSSSNVILDLGLPYYIVSRGIRTMKECRAILLWLGCGGTVLSAILFYEFIRFWPIYNELYVNYELSTLLLVKSRGGFLRAGGPFVESTSAAMILAICVLALSLCRNQFRTRWYFFAAMAFCCVGLVAPQSRGAWVGLFFAMAAAEIYRRRYFQLSVGAVVVAAGIALIAVGAQFSSSFSESIGLSGNSSDTSDYRRLLLMRGLQEFSNSPLIGFSLPEAQWRLHDLIQGEGIVDFVNSYVWIMMISGIVGLAVFIWAFVFFIIRSLAFRPSRRKRYDDAEVPAFIFSSLVMMMEMLFFTSFGTRPAIFVFGLFGFSAAFLKIAHLRAHRRSPVVRLPETPAPVASAKAAY